MSYVAAWASLPTLVLQILLVVCGLIQTTYPECKIIDLNRIALYVGLSDLPLRSNLMYFDTRAGL